MIIDFNKQKIRQCFNKAALTYDMYSKVQQDIGEKLIHHVRDYASQTNHIMDLGCGSGLVTERLARLLKYQQFYALDISDQLLLKAESRLQPLAIRICEKDFDYFSDAALKFDLIFSNMALQWSADLERVLALTYSNLASQGLFAFSMPVEGTFPELKNDAKNIFYSVAHLEALLSQCGFEIVWQAMESFISYFDSLMGALKTIKKTGANCLLTRPHKALRGKTFLQEVANAHAHAQFSLTYQIGLFIVRKS